MWEKEFENDDNDAADDIHFYCCNHLLLLLKILDNFDEDKWSATMIEP
jgi:hypothetical protein